MKQERMTFSLCLAAVVLGAIISFSCLMCVATTYSMPCDPGMLIAVCCVASGAATAAMSVKKSWLITVNVFLIYLIVMFWQHEAVAEGFSAALYHITTVFDICFRNVTVIGSGAGDMRLMFAALAIPVAWLTVWTICKESYSAFVILACSPFMMLSLIVVNLAPNAWLVLLTAALMLLIMSDGVRVRNANEGGRLIWWLVLPLSALIAVLVVVSPVQTYTRAGWSETLQQIAEGKLDVDKWRKQGAGGKVQDEVDLNKVGPKRKTGAHALSYCADTPVFYLRGMSYGRYRDGVWEGISLDAYEGLEQDLLTCDQEGSAFLRIKTSSRDSVCYTAYNPAQVPQGSVIVYDAYVENREGEVEYASAYAPDGTNDNWRDLRYGQLVSDVYVQVPQDLKDQLRQILQEQGLINASADEIASYVRSVGTYELNTPRVPEGEDFALYFLTQSRQGYCVHFASSAVLLLRAAGIPARYVTGYSVEGAAGQWNMVSRDEAHAWVEYLSHDSGWQPLDPTPSNWREVMAEQPNGIEESESDQKPDEEEKRQDEEKEQPNDRVKAEHSMKSHAGKGNQYWYLLLPILILLLILRRVICVLIRKLQCKKAEPNQRALRLWVWMVCLYKAERRAVPEEMICLAEKAKFSQHEMTQEEIAQMADAVSAQIRRLKQQPILRRLWHQYGLALY